MNLKSLSLLGLLAFVAPLEAQDPTPQQVRDAIQKGIQYLKSIQDPNTGSWERHNANFQLGDYSGGVTALATLALLESGVEPSDDKLSKALAYLERLPPRKTYVASLQAIALTHADPQRYGPKVKEILEWLAKTADESKQGTMIAWGYPQPGGMARPDHSNTQYAVLALGKPTRPGFQCARRTGPRSARCT